MHDRRPLKLVLTLGLLFNGVVLTSKALADGEQGSSSSPAATTDSARIDDKRLPPLLPGEEVNVGSKKMKVWTTAGEVPVAQAPEPWKDKSKQVLGAGASVVVDGRSQKDSDSE